MFDAKNTGNFEIPFTTTVCYTGLVRWSPPHQRKPIFGKDNIRFPMTRATRISSGCKQSCTLVRKNIWLQSYYHKFTHIQGLSCEKKRKMQINFSCFGPVAQSFITIRTVKVRVQILNPPNYQLYGTYMQILITQYRVSRQKKTLHTSSVSN